MSFYYKLELADGSLLSSNIDEELLDAFNSFAADSVKFSYKKVNYRGVRIKSQHGVVTLISANEAIVKSSRVARAKAEVLLDGIISLQDVYRKAKEEAKQHVNRLIHNLVTLNGHIIQEVYSIIPQEVMQDKRPGWRKRIMEQVADDPYDASVSLVNIAKNTLKMKAEIDVYNALLSEHPKIALRNHSIHRVLMNVVYVFFPEFTDKGIRVEVSESNDTVHIDYETFQVAIYHLIENSVKYIKPDSKLNITFNKKTDTKKLSIAFKMISLAISPDEVEKIFIEGYSGVMAKMSNRAGSGIGMHRARTLLGHNNARLSVIARHDTAQEIMLGRVYQENEFVIDFL
ncbi:hypothetical protein Y71_26850 [Kosakonia radicincitans DSM 16656]|uniref:histidine kinase-, DNA gyrase B-, and HSP90-like ATPase n=1 Tax=Kosakonia radicincitans TaxID=283686 RepID=UPI000272DA7B|nr:histidine kinase-, DNA gyrase B-, and HSP90-like ATPase [Kosakonia radicincitans]ARD63327.1 hypothetical protein Y71_26850 [Kosakonia radicincitans DSM 16656]